MASQNGNHQKSLVVVQLSGGNDTLNTVVPFNNGLYHDFRQKVRLDTTKVHSISDDLAFNPSMGPVKRLWDKGNVAVINGIGYPNPNRSHFRSMDIWHTAMPDDIGRDGWLGLATRELDPTGDNVLTAVNFGRGLPRGLGCTRRPGRVGRQSGDIRALPGRAGRDHAKVRSRSVLPDVRRTG